MATSEFIKYVSPTSENSFLKGVPMTLRNHPFITKLTREGARVRYRGPRMLAGRTNVWAAKSDCWKRHATAFSLYFP
jgi:hypothetical protein